MIYKPFKVTPLSNPFRSGRYATVEDARAAVARLGERNPTEDYRIFEVVEVETLVYTTEKGVEV